MSMRTLAILLLSLGAVARAQTPAASRATATPALPSCPELARAITSVVTNDARVRDWPNLVRYRDANRALAPEAAGEARAVFMGDSIIDNWQQPRFGGFFPGKPYINRGISGQTTPQISIRTRRATQ